MKEIQMPLGALSDKAEECARVFIDDQCIVALSPSALPGEGDPGAWGMVLSDIVANVVKMYAPEQEKDVIERILDVFSKELKRPKNNYKYIFKGKIDPPS